MPAPKGNQYAKGHGHGRPQKYNREEMALKLLEWAQKEDSSTLLGFCAEHLIPPQYISQFDKESEDFHETLVLVKAIIGLRREGWAAKGNMHPAAYHRNAAVYDHFLHEHEKDNKRFESELKKKEVEHQANLCDLKDKMEKGEIAQS